MKKQITVLILLLMTSGVIAIYGGENISFKTNCVSLSYIVIGNSSNLDGMNVTLENKTVLISFAQNFGPDNFTLIFSDNETIINRIHHSGHHIKYINKNITKGKSLVDGNTTTGANTECETCTKNKQDHKTTNNNHILLYIILLIIGIIIITYYVKTINNNRKN